MYCTAIPLLFPIPPPPAPISNDVSIISCQVLSDSALLHFHILCYQLSCYSCSDVTTIVTLWWGLTFDSVLDTDDDYNHCRYLSHQTVRHVNVFPEWISTPNWFSKFWKRCGNSSPLKTEKSERSSLCTSLRFSKDHCFLEGSQVSPVVLLTRATCTSGWKLIWSNDGMIMTGENRSTWRKTCPGATLATTNLTLTRLGFEPGLCGERTATDCPSHDNDLNYVSWFSPYRTVNTPRLGYLTK
jgi:hypothetical protein